MSGPARAWRLPCIIILGVAFISGCATYHPEPLPAVPDLARLASLTIPVHRLELPGLTSHRFDPVKGLDSTTVITLAVLNNPDLKAERLQAGVASAQLLEAGLIPDPQLSGGLSFSAVRTGYDLVLGEEIQALITRGAVKAAAAAHERQVNLDILWREWQVGEKARESFLLACTDRQLQRVLTARRDLLSNLFRLDKAALKRNYITTDKVSSDLTALADVEAQSRQLRLEINHTRHVLDRLLGLKPGVSLHLTGGCQSRVLPRAQFEAAVAALANRRPDLMALQAGYESQEQRVRRAILAQFPAMSVGVERGRSVEEGVRSVGITVNLTLPIFNRNRGRIAVARATRAVLRQTYQARLDQAVTEANEIWEAAQIMACQLQDLGAHVSDLRKIALAAQRNLRENNIDMASYVRVKLNYLKEETAAIRLRASLRQARSALGLLLALPFDRGQFTEVNHRNCSS